MSQGFSGGIGAAGLVGATVSDPLWFVLRRPEASFDSEAPTFERLKVAGGVLYQGLDRMPWWDIDDLYRAGRLPAELLPIYQSVAATEGPTDLRSAKRAVEAVHLLHAAPEVAARNEVVCAVSGTSLSGRVGPEVTWLGYDPIYKSGTPGTLLVEVFLDPSGPLFVALADLNAYGLFETPAAAAEFGAAYEALAREERVEPLPLFRESFEVLAVGRLQDTAGLRA